MICPNCKIEKLKYIEDTLGKKGKFYDCEMCNIEYVIIGNKIYDRGQAQESDKKAE